MAIQLNSKQTYFGTSPLYPSALSGLSVDEIVSGYTARVNQYGGHVLDPGRMENMVAAFRDRGVLDACSYFDIVDARWGAKTAGDGTLIEAYGLAGLNVTPSKRSAGGGFDDDSWPGVGYVTDDSTPYFLTRENNNMYAGLLSDAVQLPRGYYYVFFRTNRNLSQFRSGQIAYGPRVTIEGNSNFPTQIISHDARVLTKGAEGWAYDTSATQTDPVPSSEKEGTGDPLPLVSVLSTQENAFYVVNSLLSTGVAGAFPTSDLSDPASVPMAIGANTGTWPTLGPNDAHATYPCGFVNFGMAVTGNFEVARAIQDIIAAS